MEREDSDVSLPSDLLEAENMAAHFEPASSITFSRQQPYLTNIHQENNEIESRQDGMSRAASRNLSRVSFKPPSRHTKKRNRSRLLPTAEGFNLDDDFNYDSDEDIVPVRYSSAAEQHKNMYKIHCRKQGVISARKVLNHFGKPMFDISDLNLSSRELKPVFIVMILFEELRSENDVDITDIDISGNKLSVKDINYITEILHVNKSISSLCMRRCGLSGAPLKRLADFLIQNNTLKKLDLSDNNFDDKDAPYVAKIIEDNESIINLNVSHNKLGDSGVLIGNALRENEMISTIDLSWNHIRGIGAVGIAKGIEGNTKLLNLQISWNGFAFEGSAALGHALLHNSTLATIDMANNRIHNPAMFELLGGITKNKTLSTIRLAQNPITAPMGSIILQRIYQSKECGLKELDLEGIVVDKEFDGLLEDLQKDRIFMARYDISLPVRKSVVSTIDAKNVFNIDPIRILYFMKEHMRTIDMFLKFDKDNSNSLSKEELHFAFEMEGYPISATALDTVMNYLDTNRDGDVDLMELIDGERRLKRQLIAEREDSKLNTPKNGPSASEKREYSKTYIKPADVKSPRVQLPQLK